MLKDFVGELETICRKKNIALVFLETASALGHNGKSLLYFDILETKPNMIC